MPIYSFTCSKKTCQKNFDEICSFSDFDAGFPSVKCPDCGKKKPKPVMNRQVCFANSTDKMNDFTYAAKKNFANAMVESSNAREEAKKKGLRSPYAEVPDFTDNGNRMNFVD